MDGGREQQKMARAKALGAALFEAQRKEGFGSLELQERMYSSSRNELKQFRDKIWEGYMEKASAAYAAISL